MRRAPVLLFLTFASSMTAAEPWSGSSLSVAAVGQSVDGNEASFRTQNDLRSGFLLEALTLRYGGTELQASGIGNAEPWQRARLRVATPAAWSLSLDYDRRRSFFTLANPDFTLSRDRWHVDRWRAGAAYEGWSPARLGLALRHTSRDGRATSPLFALNETYLLHRSLDDSMSEILFSAESRHLPVRLAFEQGYTRYEQRDRRAPETPSAVSGDPDLFAAATSSRSDRERYPTSRLTATWGSDRAAFAGSALYSPAKLRGSGATSSSFDLNGGTTGRVQFIDDAINSASRDTGAASLRFAFRVAPRWSIRLLTDGRKTSTDASLLGTRLIRMTNAAGGSSELSAPLDERTTFDVDDRRARVELENRGQHYTAWAAAFSGRRDVEWRLPTSSENVSRDARGGALGASFSANAFAASAELEHGTFERYVFRVDPETTNRLTLRVRGGAPHGVDLHGQGRFERADNPSAEANLDHRSDAVVVGAGWTSASGLVSAGVDLDRTRIRTDTAILTGTSLFDLDVLTATAWTRATAGKLRITAAAARLRDRGDSFPLRSWNARARVGYPLGTALEVALFGERWSYDEERAALDDYDANRYGVALQWRFK